MKKTHHHLRHLLWLVRLAVLVAQHIKHKQRPPIPKLREIWHFDTTLRQIGKKSVYMWNAAIQRKSST